MPTANVTVTNTWTKVAEDTDSPAAVQCLSGEHCEVATVALDAAPTVEGHRLTGLSVDRATIGAGFVYARIIGPGNSAVFAVST